MLGVPCARILTRLLTLQKLFRSLATQTDIPLDSCKYCTPSTSRPLLHVGTQTNHTPSPSTTNLPTSNANAESQAEIIQNAEATDTMLPAPGGNGQKHGAQSVLEAASGSEPDPEATGAFYCRRTPAQGREQIEACAPVGALRLSFGSKNVATQHTPTPNRDGQHSKSKQYSQQEADEGVNVDEPTPKQSQAELEEDEQNERALLSHIERQAAALDGEEEEGGV